jgi:hypothetical protein
MNCVSGCGWARYFSEQSSGWLVGHPLLSCSLRVNEKGALVKAHYWGTGDRTFTNAARRNPQPIQVRFSKVEDESPLQRQNHPNRRVGGMAYLALPPCLAH